MNSIASLIAVLFLLSLASCASLEEAHRQQVCNEHGGYQQGMNAARGDQPMDLSFARLCDPTSSAIALEAYKKGYTEGLASKTDRSPKINVNIGHGIKDSQKNFHCEVRAFTDTYSAWGSTRLEAEVSAKDQCKVKHHEMHCDSVSCKGA